MCWQEFHAKARSLGFDVELDMEGVPGPDVSARWFRIGGYGGEGSLWVRPRTEAAGCISRDHVSALLADCDPYVEPIGEYDVEYLSTAAPYWAAARQPGPLALSMFE